MAWDAIDTLTISSSDPTDASTYSRYILAMYDGYTNSARLDFTVTLIDTCAATTLTIASDILTSTAISYEIGAPAHVETLNLSKVTASPTPVLPCPGIVFEVRH